jgi:hypothetical protein
MGRYAWNPGMIEDLPAEDGPSIHPAAPGAMGERRTGTDRGRPAARRRERPVEGQADINAAPLTLHLREETFAGLEAIARQAVRPLAVVAASMLDEVVADEQDAEAARGSGEGRP